MIIRCTLYMYMHIVTNSHNRRYQRAYKPIESYWKDRQTEMLNSLQRKLLIVSGDSRCDSPGFSAMYCTYSHRNQTNASLGNSKEV